MIIKEEEEEEERRRKKKGNLIVIMIDVNKGNSNRDHTFFFQFVPLLFQLFYIL